MLWYFTLRPYLNWQLQLLLGVLLRPYQHIMKWKSSHSCSLQIEHSLRYKWTLLTSPVSVNLSIKSNVGWSWRIQGSVPFDLTHFLSRSFPWIKIGYPQSECVPWGREGGCLSGEVLSPTTNLVEVVRSPIRWLPPNVHGGSSLAPYWFAVTCGQAKFIAIGSCRLVAREHFKFNCKMVGT